MLLSIVHFKKMVSGFSSLFIHPFTSPIVEIASKATSLSPHPSLRQYTCVENSTQIQAAERWGEVESDGALHPQRPEVCGGF